jgi:threonine/homoserine/homoserine lactone efflux protein
VNDVNVPDLRFASFVAVSALLIVTPGPDMALVARNAVRGGAAAASATAAGVALGILGWGVAATLGVATVLERSATLFTVLRLAGAAYLTVLGVRSLYGALRRRGEGASAGEPVDRFGGGGSFQHRRLSAFRQGLTGNLLNPKAGAIFLTVVPQFLRPGDSGAREVAMVAAFEVMLLAWLLLYGRVLARIASSRAGRSLGRAIDAAAGVVLVGLGVRVALERG